MGKPTRPDCHIDYLFGQVNTELPRVDWAANCGNLSAGAALSGALDGACDLAGDVATVDIHQVNPGRKLVAFVPLETGAPAVDGAFASGGVPWPGARLAPDFWPFPRSALR